jgi:predicted ATPase
VQTQPELLAHHYTEAGLPDQAVVYWLQAGKLAIERSANLEAISHLTKGLEVLKTLPDTPERAQHELSLQLALGSPLGIIKGYTAVEVEHVYTRAQELCQQVGESPQLFSALMGLWRFSLNRPRLRTARELGEQCFSLAQHLEDSVRLQEAHSMLGSTLLYLGEPVAALAHLEQGIALYDPQRYRALTFSRGLDPGVVCLSRAAWALWLLGYPDQALTRVHAARTLAEELSHAYSLAFALHYVAMLCLYRREARVALEWAEAAMALSRQHGIAQWLTGGMFMRGWALAEQGAVEEGIVQLQQAQAAWQALGTGLGQAHLAVRLAEAYGKGGQAEVGLRVLAQALDTVHSNAEHYYEAELYRVKGELLLRQATGREMIHTVATEAEACFQQAFDIARQQHATSLQLRALLSLSRLWQQQGQHAVAHRLLAETYGWFTEGFDTRDLQEAKALLEALA